MHVAVNFSGPYWPHVGHSFGNPVYLEILHISHPNPIPFSSLSLSYSYALIKVSHVVNSLLHINSAVLPLVYPNQLTIHSSFLLPFNQSYHFLLTQSIAFLYSFPPLLFADA